MATVTSRSPGLRGDDVRQQDLSVNVNDFGAIGDGVAVDTAAIQAASDRAQALGGVIYFPVGTYLLDAEVTVGAAVRGIVGEGAVIKRSDVDALKLFRISSTYLSMSGMTIDGNRAAFTIVDPTTYIDVLPLGGSISVTNCDFLNSPGSSIAGQTSSARIVGNRFDNWRDHAVYFAGTTATTDANEISIMGNTFLHDVSTDNGAIKFRNNVTNWTVTGNTLNLLGGTPFVQDDRSGTAGLGDELTYSNKRGLVTGNAGECIYFFGSLTDEPVTDIATLTQTILSNNTIKCTIFAYFGNATYPGLGSFEILNNTVEGVLVWLRNIDNTNYANSLIMRGNSHTGRAITCATVLPKTVIYDSNVCSGNVSFMYNSVVDADSTVKRLEITNNRFTATSTAYLFSHSSLAPNTTVAVERNIMAGYDWITNDLADGPLTVEINGNRTTGGAVTTTNGQEFTGGPGRLVIGGNKLGGKIFSENSAAKASCMLTRYNMFVHDNEASVTGAVTTTGTPVTAYAGANRLYSDRNFGAAMTMANGYDAGVKAAMPVVAL